jgi:hypothetical protein
MNANLVLLVSIDGSKCYDNFILRTAFRAEDIYCSAVKALGGKRGKTRGMYTRYVGSRRGYMEIYLWNHVKGKRVDVPDLIDTIVHEYLHHLIGNATRQVIDIDGEHWAMQKVIGR